MSQAGTMGRGATTVDPWWKGRRGEWYVLAQAGLFLLVAFGPHTAGRLPPWPPGVRWLTSGTGLTLMVAGVLWVVAGVRGLGTNLSALPCPKDDATLIESGTFAFVRHPMYSGAIWAAVGWGLWRQGVLTLLYAAALFLFFDAKASREERALCEKFAGYPAYRKRVRKLVPFVY